MAGDPLNLMSPSIGVLDTAPDTGYLYIVHQNTDYRIALATIFAAITSHRAGLENVDNTSDINKPVSILQQAALDLKANTSEVVSQAIFDQLVLSLSGYVTQSQLDAILASLNLAISGKEDKAAVTAAISNAVTPLANALIVVNQRLDELELNGGGVTQAELSQAISQLHLAITQETNTRVLELTEPLSLAVNAQILEFNTFKSALETRLTNIESIIGQGGSNINIGPLQW